MVFDPEASSLLQLSEFADITLVSVPSLRQVPEFTHSVFCVLPSVGLLISLVHWIERMQLRP